MVEQRRNKSIGAMSDSPVPLDIWIISLFESTPIDNTRPMRFAGITSAALKRGHTITHFSCTFRHSTKVERFPETKGIRIADQHECVFIYATPYSSNISLGRLKSHEIFTKNLLVEIEKRKRPDVILITLPPLSSVYEVAKWARRNNVPVVVDIIDPWPDVFLTLAPKAFRPVFKTLFFPFYLKLKEIFKLVDGVTAISNEYIEWAKSFKKEFKLTGSFFPAIDFEGVKESLAAHASPRKKDKLRIIYAGNLASSYDILCILNAATILERNHPGKSEFVICGVGPQAELIKERMKLVANIKYLGRLGHADLMAQYAIADLGLTQHVHGATQSITYKFFDYLGAGLPILNSLQSEMAKLIAGHDLGLNNIPGDHTQLAANIEHFMNNRDQLDRYKKNAIAFTSKYGDAELVYGQMIDLLSIAAVAK